LTLNGAAIADKKITLGLYGGNWFVVDSFIPADLGADPAANALLLVNNRFTALDGDGFNRAVLAAPLAA
jgi:hypothetical protein